MNLSWYDVKPTTDWDKVQASKWIWCLQYLEHLEKLNVINYFNESSGDICFFFRVVNEKTIKTAETLKRAGKKIVYLLDVNYLERSGKSVWLKNVTDEHIKNCHNFCSISDLVLCSSPYLVERVQEHGYSSVYWPPGIDNRHFKMKNEINLDRPVLVWSGLSLKAELVAELTEAISGRLLIISDREPDIPVRFKFKKWRYKKVPSYLIEGDVGVAPRLVDSSYNRGHSFFKILVYLSAGLPVLAAPLSSYRNIIEDGVNGFICDDLNEYKTKFNLLTPQMGEAAKDTANKYDSSIMARTLIKILNERL